MRWALPLLFAACSAYDEAPRDTPATSSEDAGADAPADVTGGPEASADGALLLASGQGDVVGVAANETHAYWGDRAVGVVRRVAFATPGVVEDVHTGGGTPGQMAIRGSFL